MRRRGFSSIERFSLQSGNSVLAQAFLSSALWRPKSANLGFLSVKMVPGAVNRDEWPSTAARDISNQADGLAQKSPIHREVFMSLQNLHTLDFVFF